MKRFIVKYATIAEQATDECFDSLKDAIKYCKKQVKGSVLYDGDNFNANEYYWFEIYDTNIGIWNGDEIEEEHIDEASVYVTEHYYRNVEVAP